MSGNNSKADLSVLDKNDSLTLDTTLAVVVATNRIYSDDPQRMSVAYTYYWERAIEPPDSGTLLVAMTGIVIIYTILVVYSTWKICGQKRKRKPSPPDRQQTILTPSSDPCSCAADYSLHFNFGGSPFGIDDSATCATCNKRKHFIGAKMTVGDWKRTFATKLSKRPQPTSGVAVTTTSSPLQKEGIFVFGKHTSITTLEAPTSFSPKGFMPLVKPATCFSRKSPSNNTIPFMPAVGPPLVSSSLIDSLLISSPAPGINGFAVNLVPPPPQNTCASRFGHQLRPRQQRAIQKSNNTPRAKVLTVIENRTISRPEDVPARDWNKFVTKNWNLLHNLSLHNSSKCQLNLPHRAKILDPIERRLLLEGNVSKPVLPNISQQAHWVTNMKAAFKAGRRCSNHQPRSSATSRQQPTSLSTTTQHCRLYRSQRWILQLEQQPREDLNLLHNTWRSKRKRSDSEAFTNGSNKRFRKPD
jgi:hypothetical protein